MARPLRIQFPGAWYHVTSRGNERRDIFADDTDRCRFLSILADSCAIYGVEIHAYVLMTNHFHLVAHTPQANLNRFMQRFNTTYTVCFNRRHDRSGHLFQGRYKALLVDADSYLLELSRYVHLNPVRVQRNAAPGSVGKGDILQSYPWSSYHGYIAVARRPGFLHCEKILAMTGTGDDASSRRAYRRFVRKGIRTPPDFDLREAVNAQGVLGTGKFREWLRGHIAAGGKGDEAERPAGRTLSKRFTSPEEIAARTAPVLDVDMGSLMQPRSPHRDERAIFVELCRRYLSGGVAMLSVSAALGVGASALSQNHTRLQERMASDPALRRRFEQAAGALECRTGKARLHHESSEQ